MFKFIHKNRSAVLLTVAAIMLLGAFGGLGSYFTQDSPNAAALRVNGQDITMKRYQDRARQYIYSQARSESDPAAPRQSPEALEKKAMDDLVRETVFLQEADRYGVVVTDNELASYIQSVPAFQREGKFDQQAYVNFLINVLRTSVADFEEEQRMQIKIQKWQYLVSSTIHVGPDEAQWRLQQDRKTASSEDAKAWTANPDKFREQVRQQQVEAVFKEWVGQANSRLKIESFMKKGEAKS